ncbi:MAG: N-acetylglucosamine-6-phosphate deacetylase [Brasilonema octagenarum HA4186-MV1]|jgi:N-acetylglucosamine-6-phosphate deacetylase|uniref:N-acetylglucosamine-6-phosphate deacetylase n=1 Tax=Brasilonema octagenarum UFV-OR1 TaxID=417115 RepID=A0ABX1MIF1_9CYAN|nr:N-acetylglucosamine-6-phosphate deacetylase [Brasilonema octagenarum]MBW4629465.1 N-acetylglucosamine-6-phosphate deacetylase [Brasilonema octagenarum HA4186-MV1]NMF66534.1 N-acetylglucosamine-6-phosphate deacetylase [Brasilonema octagenarum UFV-OR1]
MIEATHSLPGTPVDIINARIPGYTDLQILSVNPQGIVEQILPMSKVLKRVPPVDLQVLDIGGDWISLGGVDLQINGALGLAFPDLSTENSRQMLDICRYLWYEGIDAFLPTLVTTSVDNIQRALSVIADCMNFNPPSIPPEVRGGREGAQRGYAKILGVHLEGPFLNFQKRGAHSPEYLKPLNLEEIKKVLGNYTHLVKVMTLAPELDPTGEVIPYLRSLGITVSLGHSQATAAEAQRAFELGATMVTHAFNAMPPLHHRESGLLGAAIIHPHVMCGFIADGEHVSPTMLQILLRASTPVSHRKVGEIGKQKLFLVSDALAPLGLPDGVYPWDNRQISVKNKTARLADGTLSGTTLPLLVAVQNLVKWGICDVDRAIALSTIAPRSAIGLSAILSGVSASQLLRWHLDESTQELSWQRLFS